MSDLSVLIVNYNSGTLLRSCLASLESQTVRPDQVIIVDNASTDGSLAICREFPFVTIHALGVNSGFAAANNLGACLADREWIALLNPDACAAPDWVERLLAAKDLNPDFDGYACRLVKADNPCVLDGAGDAYRVDGVAWPRHAGHRVGIDGKSPYEVFGACGAAAMFRRSVFRSLGGFDERFFCYYEDVDFAFRLRLAGSRCLYVPDAVVRHVGSATTGWGSDFSVYYTQRNMVWTFVKNMPFMWRHLPAHIATNVASMLHFIARGRPRVILRAKWDAICGLPQVLRDRQRVEWSSVDIDAVMATLERGNVFRSVWHRLRNVRQAV